MPYDLKRSTFERDCSRAPSLDSKRSSLKQPLAEPLPVTVLRRSCSTNRNSFALSDRLQRPVMENLPPLPAGRGDGARSPGASSTIYSPTSAWNKDSTDPLVAHRMHGVSTMTMSSSPLLQAPADEFKTRNASVEDLMMMTDEALREAQEGSILEEVDDMRMRMSGKAAITSLWVCWVSGYLGLNGIISDLVPTGFVGSLSITHCARSRGHHSVPSGASDPRTVTRWLLPFPAPLAHPRCTGSCPSATQDPSRLST